MIKFGKKILSVLLLVTATSFLFAAPATKTTAEKDNVEQALNVVQSLQTTFRDIADTLLPSVVEVDITETMTYTNPFSGMMNPFEFFFGGGNDDKKSDTQEYETQGLGSGVIVEKKDNLFYVLTNNHVAGKASKINIKLNDGRTFSGKLVGKDERMDIALVSFESKDDNIPVAKLGDSDAVMPGDICLAFGAPFGYSQSVTQGIISATGRNESSMSSVSDYIQTDAAINQGNSGGPLVNIYGEVIGINTWIASQSGGSIGLGFAIPINNIKAAINSLIENGKIIYGWVGVSLLDVNEDYKAELGVAGTTGAFAGEVFIDSPAFKGGLRPGDFIVELNGKKIKSVNQLVRDVGSLPAGSKASFGVIRGGNRIGDIIVKVEEREDDDKINNSKMWPGFIAFPVTEESIEEFNIDKKKIKGVIVAGVEKKSAAAALRLQNGDVITAVNGVAVNDLKEFYEELAKATKSVNFDVYTNGGTLTTGTYKF